MSEKKQPSSQTDSSDLSLGRCPGIHSGGPEGPGRSRPGCKGDCAWAWRLAVRKSLGYSDCDNRSAYSHLCNLGILLCEGEVYIDGKSFSKLLKN